MMPRAVFSWDWRSLRSEAVEEGQAGLALQPVAKDAWWGAYFQHQLVRIYILIGEPEKALDRLESLLYFVASTN
jgi:hypothetical protein